MGDALGVPHEFKRPEQIPAQISWPLPEGYQRSHPNAPLGAWSDDGSQLLCLAECLVNDGGKLDLDTFSGKLLAWHDRGWHQSGGKVFDVGLQTEKALDKLRAGVPPRAAGGDGLGNGSLMRVLPAALLCGENALDVARLQSVPTHPHLIAQAACAVYTAAAQLLWQEPTLPVQDVMREALRLADAPAALEHHLRHQMPCGRGYAPRTLPFSHAGARRMQDLSRRHAGGSQHPMRSPLWCL